MLGGHFWLHSSFHKAARGLRASCQDQSRHAQESHPSSTNSLQQSVGLDQVSEFRLAYARSALLRRPGRLSVEVCSREGTTSGSPDATPPRAPCLRVPSPCVEDRLSVPLVYKSSSAVGPGRGSDLEGVKTGMVHKRHALFVIQRPCAMMADMNHRQIDLSEALDRLKTCRFSLSRWP